MRMWHKDLIPYLPNRFLSTQWVDCRVISNAWNNGVLKDKYTVKVMYYPKSHFIEYCNSVFAELVKRGYHPNNQFIEEYEEEPVAKSDLFKDWHNKRYLIQCFFMLEECYDCGLITREEFEKVKLYCSTQISKFDMYWQAFNFRE